MVKNPPANAGDTGSVPGPGRFTQAEEKLSPCTITTAPVLQSPGAAATEASEPESPVSATREGAAVRGLSTATREEPALQERPSTAKNTQINKNYFKNEKEKKRKSKTGSKRINWKLNALA